MHWWINSEFKHNVFDGYCNLIQRPTYLTLSSNLHRTFFVYIEDDILKNVIKALQNKYVEI